MTQFIKTDTGLVDEYGNDVAAYVWGETDAGTRALVVINTPSAPAGDAFVMTILDGRLTNPRWECSATHLDAYAADVYRRRFPVLPS